MKKSLFCIKFLLVSFIILAVSAKGVLAGERDHDGGLFLRLSAGYGYSQTGVGDPTVMKYYGPSGDINFAIGAVVLRNLALHGSLLGWTIIDPSVKVGTISDNVNGSLILSGFGVGITYYIVPINIYISPSVGIGRLTAESGGVTGETEMGPIFDFTVGKEWWVGGSWGLGFAGTVGYHSVKESEEIPENWNGYSLGIRFSATLN
jgi:hypothetical protein